jgi:tetratricopeptide (TPR) repeat protein
MRELVPAMLAGVLVLSSAAAASAQVGRVLGTVKDQAGNPIKGAIVRGENPDASPSAVTSATDEKGRFSIIGLGRGDWTFAAEAPGFRVQLAQITLARLSAPTPPLTFALEKAPLPIVAGVEGVTAKDLQQQLSAADALFAQRKFEEAAAAYQSVLATVPTLTIVDLQLGAAYRNLKNYDRAIAAYRNLLNAEPDSEKAAVGLAAAYLESGNAAEAERTLRQAIDGPGHKREAYFQLGELELGRGHSREAADWYSKAAAADGDWGKPLVRLAQLAMDAGNRDAATSAWQRAIAVDPQSPEAAESRAALERLR